MNTTEQTFFAAYEQTGSSESVSPKSSRSRNAVTAQAGRQRTGPTIESQYSDGAWYRVDQRHRDHDGTPSPHLAKVVRSDSISPTESVSVEIGSWNTLDEWQSSCLVIAAPMAPVAPMNVPPIRDTETAAVDPVSIEPHPVTESAGDATDLEEPTLAVQPVAPCAPWTAQWEVDEFAWPEELLRLQDEQSEYFRYAGEKLRDASREGLKTLAVVATREKEGCTTMAICLARAAAAAGARVALLDANLAHPELGPKLGLDFSHGWQESVTGKSTLAEAAVMALDSNLTLLPLSAAHRLPALSDPRVSFTLREVAAAFDLVVIDAGVVPAGDVPLFESDTGCPVNATLVVRDLRRTSETETLVTASRLKSLGIDAIGIAENFLPRPGSQIAAA